MDEAEKFIQKLKLPTSHSEAPSVYAFSLHKSGSTLLYNMLADLAPYAGQPYFSIQDQFFVNGITPHQKVNGVERLFQPNGYLYGGFRFFPKSYDIPNIEMHKKILLIRNPLDVMVSMYFSRISSHKIPEKGKLRGIWLKKREDANKLSIDEFARGQYLTYLKRTLSYKDMLNQDNCRVFRYEDIIYSKKDFLLEVIEFYGWNIDKEIIAKVATKHDVFPDKEKQSEHVRQVHPGNYKKHLSKETQSFLEEKFTQVLQAFGYKINAKNAYQLLNKKQET